MSGERPIFVYGTLLPGEARWLLMAEHVRDWSGATASGALFDTGRGYPAAQFNVEGTITGAALVVASENLASVIQTLDAIEVDYRTLVIAGQVVVVRRGRVVVG